MEVLTAFFITLILLGFYIKLARRIGIGQLIKEDGPDLHGYKKGTPTMGGVVFIPVILTCLSLMDADRFVIFSTALFFLIGLLDDVSSLLRKDAYGMKARTKLALQIVASAIVFYIFPVQHPLRVPFIDATVDLGNLYPFFSAFLLVGVSNAVNLTDGLDGLAGWIFVTSVVSVYTVSGDRSLLIVLAPVMAFLIYNSKPASVFMGDSGSLALGAFLASYSIVKGMELHLIFFGFVFLIETLSVILQVLSFKLTGKRIFKMAPIHHHFELSGWSEEKIVFMFGAVNLLASISLLMYM